MNGGGHGRGSERAFLYALMVAEALGRDYTLTHMSIRQRHREEETQDRETSVT